MKKCWILILVLAVLTAGCGADPDSSVQSNHLNAASSSESTASLDKPSASKTIEGEIKFYPTYDSNYKTGSNEIFDFWFDIPNEWKAVDDSEDGFEYHILTGNDAVEITMSGRYVNEKEDEFYTSLMGSRGTISDFVYRDGWVGKQIQVSDSEIYYVRVDGDSYMILHVNSKGDSAWIGQNQDKINYVAMSARTTRESYGTSLEDESDITLDDLKLGEMTLGIHEEDLLTVMNQKPENVVEEEYEGLVAKTLFFSDNTQVYVVDHIVYSINVTSSGYETPRGLKTGDSEERLKDLYGEPSSVDEENYWGYAYEGYELLTVRIVDGKVSEIQIDLAM